MSKTAEEMLKHHIQNDEEKGMLAYVAAMNEHAAQEVEAYKQRVKEALISGIREDEDVARLAPEDLYKHGYLKAMTNAKAIIGYIIDRMK